MNILHPTHPWKGVRPFSRHSLVLMVAGLVFMAIGVSYVNTEPTLSRTVALHFALAWWGFETWGYIFILAGALAIVSARWPPISETWGYMVLTGLSGAWALFYLAGVLFHDSSPSNISGVLSWGLIAFMWWGISGLVNPANVKKLFSQLDHQEAQISDLTVRNERLLQELQGLKPRKE